MSEQRHYKTEEAKKVLKKASECTDVEAPHEAVIKDFNRNRGVSAASENSVNSSACHSAIENSTRTAAPPRWYDGANQLKTTNSIVRSRTSSIGSQSSDGPNSSNCQTAEERSTKTALADSRSPSPFKWSLNSDMTRSTETATSDFSMGNYSSARSPSLQTAESGYSRFSSPFSIHNSTSSDGNTESTQYSVARNPSPMRKGLGPAPEDRSRSRSTKTTTNSMKTAASHSPAKESTIQRLLDHAVHKSSRRRSPSGSFQTLGLSRSSTTPPTEISIPRSPNVVTEGSYCGTNQIMTMKALHDGTIEVYMSVSISAPATTGRLRLSGIAPEGFKMNRIVVNDKEMTTNN